MNVRSIEAFVQRGMWQTLYRGVYAAFTGQPSRTAILWGAVLRTGPESALSYHSAAEVDGLTGPQAGVIHVTVHEARHVIVAAGEAGGGIPRILVHRSTRMPTALHPARVPPRTRVEETTIDLTQAARTFDEALAWLMRACSRRLTTPELLRGAMSARPKLRWRAELASVLADVSDGAHSALESRYIHKVEAPHGLPLARRQAKSTAGLRTRYLDNHYQQFGVAVELDGRSAHPLETRWRDIRRDNASAALGLTTLRYSWDDVTINPCRVATEIAAALRARGWEGHLRRCGPHCSIIHP